MAKVGKLELKSLESDLKRFQDIKQLKSSLRNYRIERQHEFLDFADLMFMGKDPF